MQISTKSNTKISRNMNKNKIKIRKKTMNNQWTENTSTIKKQIFSKMTVEKKNYIFIMKKKTSSQEIQKFTTRKTHENMNTNNYNKTNMWKRMMLKHEMSTTKSENWKIRSVWWNKEKTQTMTSSNKCAHEYAVLSA